MKITAEGASRGQIDRAIEMQEVLERNGITVTECELGKEESMVVILPNGKKLQIRAAWDRGDGSWLDIGEMEEI